LKVLHLFDHSLPLHSGYAFRSWNILTQQRAMGIETVQVTSSKQGPASGRESADGFEFVRTPPSGGLLSRFPVLNQWDVVRSLDRHVRALIREDRPDLIHAHSPPLVGLAACRAGAALGVPVVYEVRAFWEDAAVDQGTCREGDLRYRATHALETSVMRRAQAVTCICRGLYEEIRGRGIAPEKLTIIPNAINPDQFSLERRYDEALAARLGLNRGETVGFVGSFYAYEGLHLLLAALPQMLQRRPGLKLLLVGGGHEDGRLRAQAAALGIVDQVVFTGRVPHAEVDRYYDLIDVLAYPRIAMRLTELVTPLKPLEAMVQERLVVASDVGGHRELIDDGRTGLLFRAGDVGSLSAAVLRLLDDPALQDQLRQAGRAFVTSERTWARSVACYRDVYAYALGQRR
jgi:PEP-CTERM/exosortase A-associated glycosyltransferase